MTDEKRTPLLVITGPTASGKTALSIALAKKLDTEIISADSMQIYRDMQIATAKPTEQERQGIAHHLMDFLPPDRSFSVAEYLQLAHAAIQQVYARKKLPIVVGGTGLYISSLVDQIDFAEIKTDHALRTHLQQLAQQNGNDWLHAQLAQVDPDLAVKLHPNNLGRVIRALEVYQLTGKTMSQLQRDSRRNPSRYHPCCMIALDYADRAQLYARIDRRVDEMVAAGLVQEARDYLSHHYQTTSSQAIGYKELQGYFAGNCSLQEAIEHIKQQTRRYAKRQLTWFRRDQRIQWITIGQADTLDDVVKRACQIIASSGLLDDVCIPE